MVLLRLMRIPIMSKNDNEEFEPTITLTDPDTGWTVSLPDDMSTTPIDITSDSSYSSDYTITLDTTTPSSVDYSAYIDNGILSEFDLSSIYEKPNEKTIRKRYTGHKKLNDIGDVGVHILEKMSKRDN